MVWRRCFGTRRQAEKYKEEKSFWEKHELFANSCHWKMIEQLAKYQKNYFW